MPTLSDALKPPAMKDLVQVLQPAGTMAPPTVNPGSMPNYEALSLAPAPPILSLDIDRQRQFYRGGVSQYRISPLPIKANQQVGAVARTIAAQVVASAAAAPAETQDIESIAVNAQGGTSYTVKASDLNTLITLNNNAGGNIVLPIPGQASITNPYNFVQAQNAGTFGPGPGPQLASMTLNNSQGNLLIAQIKIDEPGAVYPTSVGDTRGNSWFPIAVTIDGGNIPTSFWYTYNINGGSNTISVLGGRTFCIMTVLEYSGFEAANPLDVFAIHSGALSSITTGAPNCLIYSGIHFGTASNPTPISGFTSRYSDSQELDQDRLAVAKNTVVTGDSIPTVVGASVVNFIASFKTSNTVASGFPAGWYTWIENTGSGTFVLSSKTKIDGNLMPISIGPNQGLLVVFDGFNWFTERGITAADVDYYQTVKQAGTAKPQEPILNFLAPITATDNPAGTSTDIAVPVFVGDSGSGGVSGLVPAPASGDAAANKLLGAGGTWVTPPASVGGVLIKSANYTAASGDTGKLITFNTSTGFTASTFVQEGHDFGFTSPTSLAVTPASNVTNGNLIVVWAEAILAGGTFALPTDSQGNTYTQVDTVAAGGYGTLTMWYTVATATNSLTVTFTKSGGGTMNFISAQVLEYSGNAASSNLDTHANNSSGSGTALTVNVPATSQQNDLIVAVGMPNSGGTLTAGSGYTQRGTNYGAEDKNLATAGTTTATMTQSGASGWGMVVGSFKGGTGGAATYTLLLPASAPSSTWMIFVQNFGTGTVIVDPNGRNLDGSASTVSLSSGKGIIIFTDGTNYYSCRGGS